MRTILFFWIALFTTTMVMAQLYVKPSQVGTDSYIFVNDEILFVEDNITLTKNSTTGQESSIYLRRSAQLIQGTGTTGNIGNGTISVTQNTPDHDAWDYTYWCAPVGNPTGTPGPGNRWFGTVRVNDSTGIISSTLAATTGSYNGIESPMTISSRWLYMKPRGLEAEADYVKFYPGTAVPPGMGFTMKGLGTTNHDQNYDFRGRANNGDITIAIYPDEWTLSGNPYPSALDLNRVFHDPDNIEIKLFRYWFEDRDIPSHNYSENQAGYGIYVPGGPDYNGTTEGGLWTDATFTTWSSDGTNDGSNGGTGSMGTSRFAPIGQGILFEGQAGGDGFVTIKNSHRRYIKEGASSIFQYRPSSNDTTMENSDGSVEIIEVEDTRIPQVRINTFFGESHARQLLLALSNESTDGFDRGFDGESPMDATAEAYFPIPVGQDTNIKPFVISTVPYTLEKTIPISFELNQQYKVELKAVEEVNLPTNNVYFWDSLNNTMQKITGGESSSILLDQGVYENRFYIVFRNASTTSSTGTPAGRPVADAVAIDFFQNNTVGQLEVSNPEGYNIKNAYVFDMSGKMVINRNNIGTEQNFTFPTSNLSDGVYLVKLTTDDNIDINYKITIHNKR